MSSLHFRLVAAVASGVVVTGTLAGGVAVAGVAAGRAPEARHAGLHTVKVHISKHSVVSLHRHLRPGATRFVIGSKRASSFQIVKPRHRYSKATLARDVNAGLGMGDVTALKRLERNVSMIGGAPERPGSKAVLWLHLKHGTYWVLDTNLAPLTPNKVRTLHVTGKRGKGSFHGTDTVRAVRSTSFAKRPHAIDHAGRLTFRNDSTDNHFVELAKLKHGKTMADFRAWIKGAQNGVQAPPPIVEKRSMETGEISHGRSMTIAYRLPRGHYVMVCWWPDADMGGMPHAFMGMYRGVVLE